MFLTVITRSEHPLRRLRRWQSDPGEGSAEVGTLRRDYSQAIISPSTNCEQQHRADKADARAAQRMIREALELRVDMCAPYAASRNPPSHLPATVLASLRHMLRLGLPQLWEASALRVDCVPSILQDGADTFCDDVRCLSDKFKWDGRDW